MSRSVVATFMLAVFAASALGAPPCVMGLSVDAGPQVEQATAHDHDCPHCPPAPCADMARDDCEAPQSFVPPRAEDPAKPPVLAAAPRWPATVDAIALAAGPVRAVSGPRLGPGPRPHLLHGQFNE